MSMSKSDSKDSNSLGLKHFNKNVIAGIIATVIIGCCVCFTTAYALPSGTVVSENAYNQTVDNQEQKPSTNEPSSTEDENAEALEEYKNDMAKKHKNAEKLYNKTVKHYKNVLYAIDKQELKKHWKTMCNATSPDNMLEEDSLEKYTEARKSFDKLKRTLEKEYTKTGGVGKYRGGEFKIPYDFRSSGVLTDRKFRYTYYSSSVLYHCKTPQWTLCNDGLYRDKKGRVVVASDDYKHGSVINSPLFGTCIVLDCGVGSSRTLDVYVGW